jgi:hypothetical protein
MTVLNALPALVALVAAAESLRDASDRHDPFALACADGDVCVALASLEAVL